MLRALKTVVSICVAAVALMLTSVASATPYSLIARYSVADPSAKTTKTVNITFDDNATNPVVPRSATNTELVGIFLHIKTDSASKAALASLRDLSFDLECASPGCEASKKQLAITPGKIDLNKASYSDVQVLSAAQVVSIDPSERVALRVDSHFTASFLCSQELALRSSKGKAIDSWKTDILPYVKTPSSAAGAALDAQLGLAGDKAIPDGMSALVLLAGKPLKDPVGGKLVFYSFCADIVAQINYDELAKKGPPNSTAAEERAAQKHVMSELLAGSLQGTSGVTGVEVASEGPGLPENVIVVDQHPFSVVKQMGAKFTFNEKGGEPLGLPKNFDQKSTIELVADSHFCDSSAVSCEAIADAYLTVSLVVTDSTKTTTTKKVPLADQGGARWDLTIDLTQFLEDDVDVVLDYNNGTNVFELRRQHTSIRNLGLITTFPGVTEVASLIQKAEGNAVNPKDSEWQSSIPVSWAFNLRQSEGRHVAVTLPFIVGYNPRGSPHLSDAIKAFAHVSAVLPVDSQSGSTLVVVGAGLALVNTLTFAWGISIADGTNFALVGISVPDLVKVVK